VVNVAKKPFACNGAAAVEDGQVTLCKISKPHGIASML